MKEILSPYIKLKTAAKMVLDLITEKPRTVRELKEILQKKTTATILDYVKNIENWRDKIIIDVENNHYVFRLREAERE